MTDGTTKTFTQSELDAMLKDVEGKLSFFGNPTSGGGAFNEMLAKSVNENKTVSSKNTTSSAAASSKTNSGQSQSSRDERDARVREQYAARKQAEDDAKYAEYDVAKAEEKLNDTDYWFNKVVESRKSGRGFEGDADVAAERDALEAEIKRAKRGTGKTKSASLQLCSVFLRF